MFSYKGLKALIFDEFPYKKYMVKCQQPPQLKYLCFDHLEFRIYKGEGNVQLIAYYPFAFSVETPTIFNDTAGMINNTGDLSANVQILYKFENLIDEGILTLDLKEQPNQNSIEHLKLEGISQQSGDAYLLINTQTQLIEGLDQGQNKTGNLYNRYITEGDFFWPPVGRTYLFSNKQFERVTYIPLFY